MFRKITLVHPQFWEIVVIKVIVTNFQVRCPQSKIGVTYFFSFYFFKSILQVKMHLKVHFPGKNFKNTFFSEKMTKSFGRL
jgi:hypothetical protein